MSVEPSRVPFQGLTPLQKAIMEWSWSLGKSKRRPTPAQAFADGWEAREKWGLPRDGTT